MSATTPTSANINALAFGSYSENVEIPFLANRSPTDHDINYPIGKRWIDTVLNQVFSLTSFSYTGLIKTANWAFMTIPSFVISSANKFNLTGTSTLTVSDAHTQTTSQVIQARAASFGDLGVYSVPTVSNGSFVVTEEGSDTSQLNYIIIN